MRTIRYRKWLLIFLLLGILLRLLRWGLAMPVWGDEAAIGLNIIRRDYLDLLRPLDFSQVAPLLFLWIQRTVCVLF